MSGVESSTAAGPADPKEAILESCPTCGYSVRGLPILHKCPECGFDVDRRWEVFGGRALQAGLRAGRVRAPWRWFLLVPVIYASAVAASAFFAPGQAPPKAIVLFLALLAAVGAYYLIRLRPKSFIALGPWELCVYRGKKEAKYAWNEMGRAQYSLMHKSIEFEYQGERVRIPVQPIFSLAVGEIDRCVQAINAHPRASAERRVQNAE